MRGKERASSVDGDGPENTTPLAESEYVKQCDTLIANEQHLQNGDSSWKYGNMQREPKPKGCNLLSGPQAKQLNNLDFYDPDGDGRLRGSATMNEMAMMLKTVCTKLWQGKTVEFSMPRVSYTGSMGPPPKRLGGTLYLNGCSTAQPANQPDGLQVWTVNTECRNVTYFLGGKTHASM